MNNELFEYEINDDSVTITKYIGNQTGVEIPAEIDGMPVTKIGDSAFRECNFLTYVDIPEGITEIGFSAFSGCSSLKSILLPNSLKKIGDRAFGRSLKSATLLKKLTNAGKNFYNLKIAAHCKCGHMFMFDPDSKDVPVCPRCGLSNQYKIPANGLTFLLSLLFFLGAFFGSVSLGSMGLQNNQIFVRCCIVLVLSSFITLLGEGINQLSYLLFKFSINPKIAKRERPQTIVNLEENVSAAAATSAVDSRCPVESASGIAESSSASKDSFADNSAKEDKQLNNFLNQLNNLDDPSQWQPLSPYKHRKAFGFTQIPAYIILGILTITSLMVATTQTGDEAGFMFGMAAFMGGILFFLLRLEFPALQLTANENGIQCNKMNPDMIPWENIRSLSFHTSPVLFFVIPVQTNMKVSITFKDGHSRSFVTRFNTELEAEQCQKTLKEHLRRARIIASQSSATADNYGANNSESLNFNFTFINNC